MTSFYNTIGLWDETSTWQGADLVEKWLIQNCIVTQVQVHWTVNRRRHRSMKLFVRCEKTKQLTFIIITRHARRKPCDTAHDLKIIPGTKHLSVCKDRHRQQEHATINSIRRIICTGRPPSVIHCKPCIILKCYNHRMFVTVLKVYSVYFV